MSLMELSGIEVTYGAAKALNGIDLGVASGEIVCLLGGNASGKSTTMKTILGLVRPVSGTVRWDGEDITSWTTRRRIASGIASVPEARRVFGPMTVEENLLMGAYTRRDRREIRANLANSTTVSPDSPSGAPRRPGRCPAGSSRCWPSPGHS